MSIAQETYRKEIEHISREIETISRIDNLNSKLHDYNWIFFHPYNQGFEIGYFERLVTDSDKESAEQKIFEQFARKFLDLKLTITMIDGFYRKRPFLSDFIRQIEESVILCIQKDFSGAINLLIPAIEGSIRNYLISKKGDKAKTTIKMADLAVAFKYMTDDYVNLQEEYLVSKFGYLKKTNDYLDVNQVNQILKKHREYFSLWIKQLNDYLNNNLYLDTRKNDRITDDFNRHNVVHGLDKIDYSFRNYLRLINCLNFLSWAFGVIRKDCSILAEIDEKATRIKWVEYFKILTISETMTETKSKIYDYKIESFKKYIDKTLLKPLSISEIFHKQLLKVNDIFKSKSH
jgi:hypothetical protein